MTDTSTILWFQIIQAAKANFYNATFTHRWDKVAPDKHLLVLRVTTKGIRKDYLLAQLNPIKNKGKLYPFATLAC